MSDFWGIVHWLFGEGPTLFGVALAISGGIALALAPQIRNIRLAHWFFAFAWMWVFGGLVEGTGNMKHSLPSYALVFFGGGIIGALALATYKWVETNHHEASPSSAESSRNQGSDIEGELREVNEFICKKDENELRDEFDFPQMLKYNIEFAKRNLVPTLVSAEDSAAIDFFFLNGQARIDTRFAHVTVVNNRANVDWIPGRIGVINTSKKYVDSRKTLSRLISSAALPEQVTGALKLVDDAIEKNSATMIESLNESLAADPRNILENNVFGTERYASASGLYWTKFIPLRPRADVVTAAVRKAMASIDHTTAPIKQQ